jgi:Fungal specific transcription factor domain
MQTAHESQYMPTGNLLLSVIGGFRTDRFNSLPIESKGVVTAAADLLCGFRFHPEGSCGCKRLAVIHIWRSDLAEEGTADVFKAQLLQHAIQHTMIFECIIAASKAFLSIQSWPQLQPPMEVLQHYGNAIILLRRGLTSTRESADDAVLWTVRGGSGLQHPVMLMGIDVSQSLPRSPYHRWATLNFSCISTKIGLHSQHILTDFVSLSLPRRCR